MDEYLSRDTVLKIINHTNIIPLFDRNLLQEKIKLQPTADVAEVVRCKDCIYYESYCCFNRQWDLDSSAEVPMVRENDYCSYGERRTDNDL